MFGFNKVLFWGILYVDFVFILIGIWEFGFIVFGIVNLYVNDEFVINNMVN